MIASQDWFPDGLVVYLQLWIVNGAFAGRLVML